MQAAAFAALGAANNAYSVDKVYHPYVNQGERELEYRFTGLNDGDESRDLQTHRLGIGYGASERIAVDAYVVGTKDGGDELQLEAYELEMRWQLNEQGANWLDNAMLFELEHIDGGRYNEVSTGFIAEKEISARWSATANIIAHYEFGDDVKDNFEGEMAAQLRYRLDKRFEPAIEAYWDENVIAVGPAAIGVVTLDGRRRLNWEAAALLSTKHNIASRIFRCSVEWEF